MLPGPAGGVAAWRGSPGAKKKEYGPGWEEWEVLRPRPGSGRGRGERKGTSLRPPCGGPS